MRGGRPAGWSSAGRRRGDGAQRRTTRRRANTPFRPSHGRLSHPAAGAQDRASPRRRLHDHMLAAARSRACWLDLSDITLRALLPQLPRTSCIAFDLQTDADQLFFTLASVHRLRMPVRATLLCPARLYRRGPPNFLGLPAPAHLLQLIADTSSSWVRAVMMLTRTYNLSLRLSCVQPTT